MSRVRILPGALFDTRRDLVFMLVVAGFSFLRGFQFWSVLACFGLRCSQNAVTEHTTITPPQTQKCPHPRPPKVKDEGIPQISTSSRIDSGTSGNRAVQSLLRHAKLDTTMVHVALDEESRRAAASVT